MGLNAVQYHFSSPLQKKEEPRNLYAISGRRWFNASADYTFTYKNVFFFGEAALDKNNNTAVISGLLASLDPKVDVSLLYRNINEKYQSLCGNAFTENVLPGHESGWYAGLVIRPAMAWRLSAYADFFKFPWLKYRVDAPSQGQDYAVQLTCQPRRQWEIYGRYGSETKAINAAHHNGEMNVVIPKSRENVRVHFSCQVNPVTVVRGRVEAVWYDKKGKAPEQGFLTFIEGSYKPFTTLSLKLRLQYFETDGYDSRIYAYETDVLYSYSIPAFSDAGYRYYFNATYEVSKKWSVWMRWATTKYTNKETTFTGLAETAGSQRSEIKMQMRYTF